MPRDLTFQDGIYDGDGLKRAEIDATTRTTIIWDGSDYLQGRS